MSPVEKIKLAAAELGPDEQYELFRWWVGSESFKQRQLSKLRHDIALGLGDFENGRYQTYIDASVMQLAEEVGRSGREQLAKNRKTPTA